MAQKQNIEDIPLQKGSVESFTRTVFVQSVAASEDGKTTVSRVSFEKGAHTFWHTHGGEQVLYFLEGKGRVFIEGEGMIDAQPGDVVHIPPHTRHWHGAHPNEQSRMRHLAITNNGVTWLEPVPDDIYNK